MKKKKRKENSFVDSYFSEQNLCTTAAYRPVRELIQKERKKELVIRSDHHTLKYYNHERNTLNSLWKLCYHYLQEKLKREKGGIPSDATKKNEKEEPIILRPLNMSDLKEAKNQVSPSFLI